MTPDLKAMMEALDEIEVWWNDADTLRETQILRSGIEAMAAERKLFDLCGSCGGEYVSPDDDERESLACDKCVYERVQELERELAQAKRKVLEKGADLMSLRADVTGYKKQIRQADLDLSVMKEELAQAKEDTLKRVLSVMDKTATLLNDRDFANNPYRRAITDELAAIDAASQGGGGTDAHLP